MGLAEVGLSTVYAGIVLNALYSVFKRFYRGGCRVIQGGDFEGACRRIMAIVWGGIDSGYRR